MKANGAAVRNDVSPAECLSELKIHFSLIVCSWDDLANIHSYFLFCNLRNIPEPKKYTKFESFSIAESSILHSRMPSGLL